MNSGDSPLDAPPADAAPLPTAGMILAHRREAAGLTIDDVALQLKLAPRQVVAIERDDFPSLPGRTFIRGFVRNYARLLKLDVDAVLDALPGEHGTPPDRPPLAATSRAMGELPRERAARPNIARWAIPLVLIAIVAVAAYYEFARPPASRAPPPVTPAPTAAPISNAVPLANPIRPETGAPTAPADQASVSPAPATAPIPETTSATPPSAPNAPATGAPAAPGPTTGSSPASPLATPAALVTVTATPAAPDSARNTLALRFRGVSWIEVRDRSGSVVLSMTGSGGATREIVVATPGEVIVGNITAVDASWRGRALDLAGQAKQNVARIRLD